MDLVPGTVLSVPSWWGPFLAHFGIVSDQVDDRGVPLILHNGPKGVREESWEAFTEGREVYQEGHLGELTPSEVVARARSKLDQPWRLWSFNCEDYIHYAHGLSGRNTQVTTWAYIFAAVGVLAVGVVLLRAWRRRRLLPARLRP